MKTKIRHRQEGKYKITEKNLYLEEWEQMPPRGAVWIERGEWFSVQGRFRVRGDDGKIWILGCAVGGSGCEKICIYYWQRPEFHNPPDPVGPSPSGYFKNYYCKFSENVTVEYKVFEDDKKFWKEKEEAYRC